jgi:hypothetical protein
MAAATMRARVVSAELPAVLATTSLPGVQGVLTAHATVALIYLPVN